MLSIHYPDALCSTDEVINFICTPLSFALSTTSHIFFLIRLVIILSLSPAMRLSPFTPKRVGMKESMMRS